MKLTDHEQTVVDEIAKNAYAAEIFGKARTDLVKGNKKLVERYESEFRAGVPAEFEYENCVIRCKLVLTPAPKWSVRDCLAFGPTPENQ